MDARHVVVFGTQDSGAHDVACLFGDFDRDDYVQYQFISMERPLLVTFLNAYPYYYELFLSIAKKADLFMLVMKFSNVDMGDALQLYSFVTYVDFSKVIIVNSEPQALDTDVLRAYMALNRCGVRFSSIITEFEAAAVRNAVQ